MTLTPEDIFQKVQTRLANTAPADRKLNHVYKWHISGVNNVDKTYMLDLKQYKLYVGDEPAECTLSCSAETMISISNGELDPKLAVEQGTLKVDGEKKFALELIPFIKLT